MASVSVRDTDLGLKALIKRMRAAKTTLTVGVHAAEGAAPDGPGGATIADVASYNEFGTSRIPERSFLRAWFDENADKNNALASRMFRAIHEGKISLQVAMDRLGLSFVGGIQAKISGGVPPPNADSTIRRKGSSKPLIDTGQLRSSIRHKVTGA